MVFLFQFLQKGLDKCVFQGLQRLKSESFLKIKRNLFYIIPYGKILITLKAFSRPNMFPWGKVRANLCQIHYVSSFGA